MFINFAFVESHSRNVIGHGQPLFCLSFRPFFVVFAVGSMRKKEQSIFCYIGVMLHVAGEVTQC